jgi:hypothetical protein
MIIFFYALFVPEFYTVAKTKVLDLVKRCKAKKKKTALPQTARMETEEPVKNTVRFETEMPVLVETESPQKMLPNKEESGIVELDAIQADPSSDSEDEMRSLGEI